MGSCDDACRRSIDVDAEVLGSRSLVLDTAKGTVNKGDPIAYDD